MQEHPLAATFYRSLAALALASAVALPAPVAAQPLTERTPSLPGAWITAPGHLHFQFAHRFTIAGQDVGISDLFGDGKVVNYPTFDVALGLFEGAMAGFRYSSQSIGAGSANEWQPYLKVSPIRQGRGPVSFALTGAWNGANQSLDGELAAEARAGVVFFTAALRGFSDIYDLPGGVDDEALAVAGGVGLKVNRYVTLAADWADLVAGPDGDLAWSAGLAFGIPYTPHTVTIMATNMTSGTLAGSSTGARTFVSDDAVSPIFWGFEFTVPFSGFARWGQIFDPDELRTTPVATAGRRVVEVDIQQIGFRTRELRVPIGTTVRWVNKDPVAHTVTPDAEGATWGSAMIGPGEIYEFTFDAAGAYPYHCIPHPFMQGVIVVEGG